MHHPSSICRAVKFFDLNPSAMTSVVQTSRNGVMGVRRRRLRESSQQISMSPRANPPPHYPRYNSEVAETIAIKAAAVRRILYMCWLKHQLGLGAKWQMKWKRSRVGA